MRVEGTDLAAAEAAAAILVAGGIPEATTGFDEAAVGPFGAGYLWLSQPLQRLLLIPDNLAQQPSFDSVVDEFRCG